MTEVQERDRVVDILRGMIADLYNDPTPENLEGLVRAGEEALTKLKRLAYPDVEHPRPDSQPMEGGEEETWYEEHWRLIPPQRVKEHSGDKEGL